MASVFKPGDVVRQVLPAPLTGTVSRLEFDGSTGNIRVVFTAQDGNDHGFDEDAVELVPA